MSWSGYPQTCSSPSPAPLSGGELAPRSASFQLGVANKRHLQKSGRYTLGRSRPLSPASAWGVSGKDRASLCCSSCWTGPYGPRFLPVFLRPRLS